MAGQNTDEKTGYRFSFIRFIIIFLLVGYTIGFFFDQDRESVGYSQARVLIESGRVQEAIIDRDTLQLLPNTSHQKNADFQKKMWVTNIVGDIEQLEEILIKHHIDYRAPQESGWFIEFVRDNGFLMFLILLGVYFVRAKITSTEGAVGKLFNFSEHKGRKAESISTTFEDVAGHINVKAQLQEIVQFLKDPDQFQTLGAKVPKGVLMFGPPGTGKTLMARATAGEAGVPFIHLSGSDFDEMFVGVGAGRVSSLFEDAKNHAPCIIFIDELDSVGKRRESYGPGSGREQTINKLLSEMDGFEATDGIVVMAASNRPEILDEALERRFSRKVFVGLPNRAARVEILEVHTKDKVTKDIDYQKIAALTPGMSGAALADIFNEAALLATREEAPAIKTSHLLRAIEFVVVGHKDKARRLSKEDRQVVAIHEAGHAVTRASVSGYKRVNHISIIPTSMGALGYNIHLPEEESEGFLQTRQEILDDVICLLGGRAAEEVILNDISTGAADDLHRANTIIYEYITRYGFAEDLLNRVFPDTIEWSETTAATIDVEVQRLLEACYVRAKDIVSHNRGIMSSITAELLEKEEMSGDYLSSILSMVTVSTQSENVDT